MSKYDQWFETGAGMPRVSKNNSTTFFTTGEAAFGDIAERLEFDANEGAQAFILGWSFDQGVTMQPAAASMASPPLSTLAELLKHFANKGGAIYAMLWNNTFMTPRCDLGVSFINGLSKGKAILDRRTPLAGAHHQKIQAIVDKEGLPVAYCGGMDLVKDRIGGSALHDVHAKIIGDAAVDLVNVFLERWNDHPDNGGARTPKLSSAGGGSDFVQVCRTYPCFGNSFLYSVFLNQYGDTLNDLISKNGGPPPGVMKVGGRNKLYGFYDTGKGVQQVWQAVRKAITEAKKYIYLEDQYLINQWVGNELARKLAKANQDFRIVILTLHPDLNTDIEQMWQRRREVLAALIALDPAHKRWKILTRRRDRPSSYVHSKTWIFDDELVITGSANADRRGYTYNSEADVVVGGDLSELRRSEFGATTVAQDLRCRLFAKHLGGKPNLYIDPMPSIAKFFASLKGTNVEVFNPSEKTGNRDKYVTALVTAASKPPFPAALLNALSLYPGGPDQAIWDFVEDPDSAVPPP